MTGRAIPCNGCDNPENIAGNSSRPALTHKKTTLNQ